MRRLAEQLESAADALTTANRSLAGQAVSPGAFGADEEGTPGLLGRRLHEHWVAVLAARSQEAAEAAGRLMDLASDVRLTAKSYTETDDEAGRRLRRGI